MNPGRGSALFTYYKTLLGGGGLKSHFLRNLIKPNISKSKGKQGKPPFSL